MEVQAQVLAIDPCPRLKAGPGRLITAVGRDQWTVGFALETEDQRFRALAKLERKSCDLMVLNGPDAMNAATNQVEILDDSGTVLQKISGSKEHVARGILAAIQQRLVEGR